MGSLDGALGMVEGPAVDNEFVDRLLSARVTAEESRRFAMLPVGGWGQIAGLDWI